MKLVIVESPYAPSEKNTLEDNLRYARACIADCLKRGEAPFASHLLYTQEGVLDDTDKDQRELGIKAGFAWRSVAAMTVFYLDLGWSPGMVRGFEDCRRLHGIVDCRLRLLYGKWCPAVAPKPEPVRG